MSKLKARNSSLQIAFLGVPDEKLLSKSSGISQCQPDTCVGMEYEPQLLPSNSMVPWHWDILPSTLRRELPRFLANKPELRGEVYANLLSWHEYGRDTGRDFLSFAPCHPVLSCSDHLCKDKT